MYELWSYHDNGFIIDELRYIISSMTFIMTPIGSDLYIAAENICVFFLLVFGSDLYVAAQSETFLSKDFFQERLCLSQTFVFLYFYIFLASPDAQEVMLFTDSLTHLLTPS